MSRINNQIINDRLYVKEAVSTAAKKLARAGRAAVLLLHRSAVARGSTVHHALSPGAACIWAVPAAKTDPHAFESVGRRSQDAVTG